MSHQSVANPENGSKFGFVSTYYIVHTVKRLIIGDDLFGELVVAK